MTPKAWSRLAAALEHYQNLGFEYVDAAWITDSHFVQVTIPQPAMVQHVLLNDDIGTNLGCLVGSAEQSLLGLLATGQLSTDKRYVACTPCFRQETSITELTRPWFMKVELFCVGRHDARQLAQVAYGFLSRWVSGCTIVEADQWDIVAGDVELGSYGVREYQGHTWTYGTGLAEPRYSITHERQWRRGNQGHTQAVAPSEVKLVRGKQGP